MNTKSNAMGKYLKIAGAMRQGLASILYTKITYKLWSQDSLQQRKLVRGPSGHMRWESNLAVWGQIATGGGHPTLQETMSEQ